MLDQNTDRMWYVIGAVIIGAALIFIMNSTFPQLFASVGESFNKKADEVSDVIAKGEKGLYTRDEIQALIDQGYIPVSNASELNSIRDSKAQTFGADSEWEGKYTSGLDKKYVQLSRINLSAYANFQPIGHYNGATGGVAEAGSPFTGTYDGAGFVVSNLTIDNGDKWYTGLFGATANEAVLENIGVINASVHSKGGRIGLLVGWNGDSVVRNAYSSGSVSGSQDTGGLVGINNGTGLVHKSHSSATVKGIDRENAGGLAGWNGRGGTITQSYATGNVRGVNDVGGLVGNISINGTITDSYATGDVKAVGVHVGGFVGNNEYETSVIERSYSTGHVIGYGPTGGFVGKGALGKVVSSYYNTDTSGYTTSEGGVGLSTADMRRAKTYIGWDSSIWTISDGHYPTLLP